MHRRLNKKRRHAGTDEKSGAGSQKLAPLPQQPQSKIVVPLPALAPGHYLVSWRALSADGHVVAGQLHFTLNQ